MGGEKFAKSLLLWVVYKLVSLTPHKQIDLTLMSTYRLWEPNTVLILDNRPVAKLATGVTHWTDLNNNVKTLKTTEIGIITNVKLVATWSLKPTSLTT